MILGLPMIRNGEWVYNYSSARPEGTPERPKDCIFEVYEPRCWSHQCCRPRGHGKNGLFCKQHAKVFESNEKAMEELELLLKKIS